MRWELKMWDELVVSLRQSGWDLQSACLSAQFSSNCTKNHCSGQKILSFSHGFSSGGHCEWFVLREQKSHFSFLITTLTFPLSPLVQCLDFSMALSWGTAVLLTESTLFTVLLEQGRQNPNKSTIKPIPWLCNILLQSPFSITRVHKWESDMSSTCI